jgi:hypothetical protein
MTLAMLGLKSFPNDRIATYTYYSILADYIVSNNSKKFKDMHKEAVAEMKKLLTKTSGQGMSRLVNFSLKNEFYFQTKQFKIQHLLGMPLISVAYVRVSFLQG